MHRRVGATLRARRNGILYDSAILCTVFIAFRTQYCNPSTTACIENNRFELVDAESVVETKPIDDSRFANGNALKGRSR
jgi:hypothetical protein